MSVTAARTDHRQRRVYERRRAGLRRPASRTFEVASDVDYVRGHEHDPRRRSWPRAAVPIGQRDELSRDVHVLESRCLQRRQARTYTQRIGDPLVEYFNAQTRRLCAGRHPRPQEPDAESGHALREPDAPQGPQQHRAAHGPDVGAVQERHDDAARQLRPLLQLAERHTYEQTLRVDGFRQRDLFIVNPTYPDPGTGGTIRPPTSYLLGPDVQMGRTQRVSAGIDQTINPKVRVNASFQSCARADQLRGQNLNAPVNGVRPDPRFANIIQTVSDAEQHNDQLSTTLNVNLAGGVRNAAAARWNSASHDVPDHLLDRAREQQLRRTVRRAAQRHARHRMGAVAGRPAAPVSAVAELPGAEEPQRVAVARRQHRHALQHHHRLRRQRRFALQRSAGRRRPQQRPHVGAGDRLGEPDVLDCPSVRRAATRAQERPRWRRSRGRPDGPGRLYRLVFTLAVNNLTNRANFSGFSGIQTSPFFLTPSSAHESRGRSTSVSALRFWMSCAIAAIAASSEEGLPCEHDGADPECRGISLQSSGPYQITHTYNVGGDGSWDYIVPDPRDNRLFIGRQDRVMVVDENDGRPSLATSRASKARMGRLSPGQRAMALRHPDRTPRW